MSNKNKIITGQIISTLPDGTAPITCSSTTNVSTLLPQYAEAINGLNFATTTWIGTAASAPIAHSIFRGLSDVASDWTGQLWGPVSSVSGTLNTSAGSVTLTIGGYQSFQITGSTAGFVVNLPNGTATSGYSCVHYLIFNRSTQTVAIKTADGNTLVSPAASKSYHIICHTPGTDAVGDWNAIGPMNV